MFVNAHAWVMPLIVIDFYIPTYFFVGYKLAQEPCCHFETNGTETTCTVNITALPFPTEESLLVLKLVPTSCNFVSNRSQLLVFVEHIVAGMRVACMHYVML